MVIALITMLFFFTLEKLIYKLLGSKLVTERNLSNLIKKICLNVKLNGFLFSSNFYLKERYNLADLLIYL